MDRHRHAWAGFLALLPGIALPASSSVFSGSGPAAVEEFRLCTKPASPQAGRVFFAWENMEDKDASDRFPVVSDSARDFWAGPDIPAFEAGRFQAREGRLRHDVSTLANDGMEGRFTGSPQDSLAAMYIAKEFMSNGLRPLFPIAPRYDTVSPGKTPGDYGQAYRFHARWDEEVRSRNVVGVVPGTDSLSRHRYIVVGAHFDHLGWGDKGGNSRLGGERAIHNGADDNASGVAMLLELARYYAQYPLPKTLVFVAFSGEEVGLCGSQAFLEQFPFPLRLVDAMFNMDMLGNLQDNTFCICGTGTSKEAESMVRAAAKRTGLELTTYPDGHGPSDHAVFYDRKIPVFFFSTPPRSTYHTPADDPETLDYEGMVRLSPVIGDLLEQVAGMEALHFTSSGKPKRKMMGMGQFKATLGLMPDINNTDRRGLRTMIVVEGKPAHNAGIRSGDVLLRVDGKRVHSLDDYMEVLKTLSFGEQIRVHFISKETGRKLWVTVNLTSVAERGRK